MKRAMIAVPGILLLGLFASMQADDNANGSGHVVLAFTGGSAYTTATGGVCIWMPVLLGDLKLASLFAPSFGPPIVDKEHAYLIWVSDFSAAPLNSFKLTPSSPGTSYTLQLVQAGTATIYFSETPTLRDWSNLNNRHNWGQPVATFVRNAGVFQSADGGWSGSMTNTAELLSSKPFKLNGKTYDFKDLMPHGMTCFETGSGIGNLFGDDEVGTCTAIGRDR